MEEQNKTQEKQIQHSKPEKKPKKETAEKKERKTEAVVNGNDLHIGRKHAVALSNFIRGKNIDKAISELEEVEKMKKPIPMRGEIPHRHGMMSGRYPVKGAGIFIMLLKSLKSNAIANDLELEDLKIFVMSNRASRPYKRFGQGRFKRTHVTIKLIPKKEGKNK
jgi:ribosomal protein L22